jgi:hypothetical protein
MSRIDIKGQFDVNNPWGVACSKTQEFRINREQLPPNQQPSNWNQFCDDMDQKLQQLTQLRKTYGCVSSAMLFTTLCIMVPAVAIGNIFLYRLVSPTVYVIYILSIFPLPFIFICKMRKILITLKEVFADISSSCSMYTIEGVVTYELHDEWWGGCSKPYSRRRFFVVNVLGGAGQDIEQQSGGNAVSYPVQTYNQANENPTASTTPVNGGNAVLYSAQPYGQTNANPTASTTPANGGTSGSLFNELSSGI